MRIISIFLRLFITSTFFMATNIIAAETQKYSQGQLDQMLAPIALYPDALLSQVLMASTYPAQVANAAKWSKENTEVEGDAAVKAVQDKGWDASVASLAAFPEVLGMMEEKPEWTRSLGDAFLAEPDAVMDTAQELRKKAKDAGNLKDTKEQKVVVEDANATQVIQVLSTSTQTVYVPVYNPIYVYGPWWYPAYRPFYYYPPYPRYGFAVGMTTGIGFGVGIAVTNSLWGRPNWHSHDININVNKYNSINVNNKIDANKANWKDNDRSKRTSTSPLKDTDKRQEFRGKELQRQKAADALKGKGIDPSKEREALRGTGGEKVRDQVQHVNRDKLSRPPAIGSHTSGSRGQSNALSGIGSGRSSGLESQRGSFSQHSFSGGGRNHGGGGRSFSGGGRMRR